jgi:hypothetical protein
MEMLGVIAAVVLPFWNIPLILRIQRRRSSRDISLLWTLGVLGCLLLMLPAGWHSPDRVFRVFTVGNAVLFSVVAVQVLRYRKGC